MAEFHEPLVVAQRTPRQERAAGTRRRMLDAAAVVFSSQGYGKATMQAIAGVAGVAVQTLYFTFHTKADLLQATYEHVVLGPDAVPPHLTPLWRRAEESTDARIALAHIVEQNTAVLQRAAPLVWAVRSDPDAQAAYRFNEGLRADGYQEIVRFPSIASALRPGLTAGRARDIMLVLLGPHVFMALTTESGWSVEEYAAWTLQAVQRELLPD